MHRSAAARAPLALRWRAALGRLSRATRAPFGRRLEHTQERAASERCSKRNGYATAYALYPRPRRSAGVQVLRASWGHWSFRRMQSGPALWPCTRSSVRKHLGHTCMHSGRTLGACPSATLLRALGTTALAKVDRSSPELCQRVWPQEKARVSHIEVESRAWTLCFLAGVRARSVFTECMPRACPECIGVDVPTCRLSAPRQRSLPSRSCHGLNQGSYLSATPRRK